MRDDWTPEMADPGPGEPRARDRPSLARQFLLAFTVGLSVAYAPRLVDFVFNHLRVSWQ